MLKGFPRRTKSSSRTLPAEWSALSEVGGHPYTPKTPENSVATTTSSNLTTRDLRVSISQSKSFGSSVSHYTHNSESVAHPTEHTELPFPRESICNYFVRPKRNPAAKFNANPFDSETSLAKSNFMKRCSLPAATNKDALRSASVRMRRQSNYYLNSTRTPRASEASDLHVARYGNNYPDGLGIASIYYCLSIGLFSLCAQSPFWQINTNFRSILRC